MTMVVFKEDIRNDLFQLLFSLKVEERVHV